MGSKVSLFRKLMKSGHDFSMTTYCQPYSRQVGRISVPNPNIEPAGKVATYDWVPFLLVATKVGFTQSWDTSISQSNQLWQIDCISCGKIHDFNKLNWTKPDLTLLKSTFQIIWDLLFKFHRPGSVLRWRVQIICLPAESVRTKTTSLWTCPKFMCAHIIFKQKSCTSFNRESLSFQCSGFICSLVKGG